VFYFAKDVPGSNLIRIAKVILIKILLKYGVKSLAHSPTFSLHSESFSKPVALWASF
jgi:hypothetical protein